LGLAACGSAGAKSDKASTSPYAPAPDPSAPRPTDGTVSAPWTSEFNKPAMLVADDIQVEGPRGLLEHIAVRVIPENHDQVQKTIPAGFLQQVTVKAGATDGEIKAQLDNLSIVATRRLSVLERPGNVDVVVQARGEAFWKDLGTKQEKRSEAMRFQGTIPR
jgi:hypothetical protein